MNESLVNTTYTNLGNITLLNLALRSCGGVEKGVSGYLNTLLLNNGGRPVNVVGIMEFRDDRIAHETLYFGDPFDPPKWRISEGSRE